MIKNTISDILGSRKRRKNFLKISSAFVLGSALLIYLSILKGDIQLDSEYYLPKTEVVSGDNFEASVIFNDEMNTSVFSDKIIKEISLAKESIDLAMYSMNMELVKEALIEAEQRGVRVNIILDESRSEQHEELFGKTSILDIDSVGNDLDSAGVGDYMHHKFLLIDKESHDPKLFAGSFNYTAFQEKYDPSFVLETSNADFIAAIVEEYDLLDRDKRGYKKLREESYMPFNSKLSYANGDIEVWFSPGFKANSVKYRMLDLIEEAEEEIQIVIWRVTDDDIAKALYAKSLEGVKVKILTDDYYVWGEDSALNTLFSRAQNDENENMEIVSDFYRTLDLGNEIDIDEYFNPYLHQHTMLIDRETVVSGTNNWTYNGFYKNDEMVFISDVPEVVTDFLDSFDFHYDSLKGRDLDLEFEDGKLTFMDTFGGEKLLIFEEVSEVKNIPSPCFETALRNFDSFEIPEDCMTKHSLFLVLDKEDNLVSSGYLK
jgi:phosphatidylserine/phosphatidylglycerophosphate/cardiolipin synthase-like enzyme